MRRDGAFRSAVLRVRVPLVHLDESRLDELKSGEEPRNPASRRGGVHQRRHERLGVLGLADQMQDAEQHDRDRLAEVRQTR